MDLAPAALVVAWKEYFAQKFPELHIVCFTSFPKTKEEKEKEGPDPGNGKLQIMGIFTFKKNPICYDLITICCACFVVLHKQRKKRTYTAIGPRQLLQACQNIVQGKGMLLLKLEVCVIVLFI